MMVDYLRVYPTDGMAEMDITRWDHARFKFLKKVYANELQRKQYAIGDDEQVGLRRTHAIRAYLLYLVGTMIFMDKSATYTDIICLWYFEHFERIHEYKWGRLFGLLVLKVIIGL